MPPPAEVPTVTPDRKDSEAKAEGARAFRRAYFGTFGVIAALLSVALVVWMLAAGFVGFRLWMNETTKPEPAKSSNSNPFKDPNRNRHFSED